MQRIPGQTTVVRFDLTDRPPAHYWLILRQPQPELCTNNVGYVEDIVCRTQRACLVDLHLKRITYPDAIRTGRLTLDGPPTLIRQFPTWFRTSPFADFVASGDVQRAAAAARRDPNQQDQQGQTGG